MESFHTLTWFHAVSELLKTPSLLESKSFNASKPLAAFCPLDKTELFPNNSVPSSICPFPLRSLTSRPSSFPTQEVFSANPLLSWSKCVPFSEVVVSTPSPSRSTTSGERVVVAVDMLSCIPLRAFLILCSPASIKSYWFCIVLCNLRATSKGTVISEAIIFCPVPAVFERKFSRPAIIEMPIFVLSTSSFWIELFAYVGFSSKLTFIQAALIYLSILLIYPSLLNSFRSSLSSSVSDARLWFWEKFRNKEIALLSSGSCFCNSNNPLIKLSVNSSLIVVSL